MTGNTHHSGRLDLILASLLNLLTVFALLTIHTTSLAQVNVTKLAPGAIPASVRYAGQLTQAVRWTDGAGEQLLLLTTAGPTKSKSGEADARDAKLMAQHYRFLAGSYQPTWQMQDYVNDCPFDLTLHFIDKTLAVTDLNNDGRTEVWLMYKTACRSDVSPAALKIVMHERGKKYAVRGETKVKVSAAGCAGGSYTFDDAFRRGPAPFRQYADKLWQQHKLETGQ